MILRAYPLATCAALSCLGYGFGLGRLTGIEAGIGDAGILGIACIALLGCALHFVSALTTTVQVATIGVGLALCFVLRAELVSRCRGNLVPILVGVSVFFHRQAFTFYDNGFYHLQSVKWSREFAITPGLANLHTRLAYNSLIFVMAPLDDMAEFGWISNLLLLLFVLMSCYARFSRARHKSVEFWFSGLAVAFLALGTLGPLNWLGVLNADGFAAILTVYWFVVALSLPSQPQTDVPLLLIAAVLGLTVKLSVAPLLLLALSVAWIHRRSVNVLKPMAAAGVLLGLWMARGITLSGCAVFPSPFSCIPNLPWALPRIQAELEMVGIRSWAREPMQFDYARVMAGWTWLGPWGQRALQASTFRLFLFGGIAGCITAVVQRRVCRPVIAAYAGILLCLAYWFWSAPDVRFGSGYLATAGILGLSMACAAYFPDTALVGRLALDAVALSVLLGIASLMQLGNTWAIENRTSYTMRIGPDGRQIWVPYGKYDNMHCWDHPLPCSPYFEPENLKRVRWR